MCKERVVYALETFYPSHEARLGYPAVSIKLTGEVES